MNEITTMDGTIKKRNTYMDVLTVISCFAVICLHTANYVWDFHVSSNWFFAMFIQAAFHWPVPVFIMLSAANLLNYRDKYTTKEFFKKRMLRTFVPFVIWSAIALVYTIFMQNWEYKGIRDMIQAFMSGNIWSTYWYFYTLFPLYLMFPVLGKLFKAENKKILWYWFCLAFFFNAIIPNISYYTDIHLNGSLTPAITLGYLGYVVLGWLLANTKVKDKILVPVVIVAVLGAIGMFFGTYHVNLDHYKPGEFDRSYLSYLGVATYAMAAAVFLVVKRIPWDRFIKAQWSRSLLVLLSRVSLGVYLVHYFVINFFKNHIPYSETSIRYMVLMPFVVYAVSVCIVIVVRKIPVVKHIFP
ncbi:MAG: acyltransferase family protein [Lachnospiraceae bacterium]|nr:acyltransferase family protein [Lachnospiraceae bacterium]